MLNVHDIYFSYKITFYVKNEKYRIVIDDVRGDEHIVAGLNIGGNQ